MQDQKNSGDLRPPAEAAPSPRRGKEDKRAEALRRNLVRRKQADASTGE